MGAPIGNQNAVGHGAPLGNQNAVGNRGPVGQDNAVRGRQFRKALMRQIAAAWGEGDYIAGLDRVAFALLEEAMEKRQSWALLEIANRIDGKPVQALAGAADDEGGALLVKRIERVIVDAGNAQT